MTCPNCGTAGPPATATCAHCGAVLSFTVPASAQPAPAAGLYTNAQVRSVRGVGIAAMVLAGLTALGSLAFNVMTNLARAVDGATATASSRLPVVVSISMLSGAATIVLMVWLWRARKNVDAMVGAAPRWTAGWTIGAWFIPLANLVLVPLVIVDVVRHSLDEQRARRTTAVVWAWAGVQLVGGLAVGGLAAAVPFAAGVAGQTRAGMMFVVTAGLALAGAALKIAFIAMLTAGQHERIAPALGEPRRMRDLPPRPLAPVRTDRPPFHG